MVRLTGFETFPLYLSFFIEIDLSNFIRAFVQHFGDMVHHCLSDKCCRNCSLKESTITVSFEITFIDFMYRYILSFLSATYWIELSVC